MAASILNHASAILTATAGFVVGDGTESTEHAVGEPVVRAIVSQGKDAFGQDVSPRREIIFQHIKLTRSTFPTFPQSTHSIFLLSILILIMMIACMTATASEAGFVRTDSADTIAVDLVVEGC